MINLGNPGLDVVIKRKICKEQLSDIPSTELGDFVKSYIQNEGSKNINVRNLSALNKYDDIFLAGGACDVLRERHGDVYIENLTGIKTPKSIVERVNSAVINQIQNNETLQKGIKYVVNMYKKTTDSLNGLYENYTQE